MSTPLESAQELALEGRRIARYLLDVEAAPDVIDRYRRANELRLPPPHSAEDVAIIRFVARHPWSLPFLDAATALLRPDSLLRKKILLMLAILETCPELADRFDAAEASRAAVLLRVAAAGVSSVWKLALGLVVFTLGLRARSA